MKLSKLISLAKKAKEEHGNIEVVVFGQMSYHLHKNKSAEAIPGKRHYRGFIATEAVMSRHRRHGGNTMFTEPYQSKMEAKPDIIVFNIHGSY